MKNTLVTLAFIVGIFVFIFAANEFEIFGMRFWGVRQENARREVFEHTQSYIQGKRQELIKLHHEWITERNSDNKLIIQNTVRQSFANFDDRNISDPVLYSFLTKCKYE